LPTLLLGDTADLGGASDGQTHPLVGMAMLDDVDYVLRGAGLRWLPLSREEGIRADPSDDPKFLPADLGAEHRLGERCPLDTSQVPLW